MELADDRTQWLNDWKSRQTTDPAVCGSTWNQCLAGFAAVEVGDETCDGDLVVRADLSVDCDAGCAGAGRHQPERVSLCVGDRIVGAGCVCRLCRPSRWNHPALS